MRNTSIYTCDQVIAARGQAEHLDRRAASAARTDAATPGIIRTCLLVSALGLSLQACDNAEPSAPHDRINTQPGISHSPIVKNPPVESRSPTYDLPSATFNDLPAFHDHPASLYNGKAQLPDFRHQAQRFRYYRSAIVARMNNGVNFSGHLALVDFSCGTECSFYYVADLRTGKIYPTPITLNIRQRKVEYQPNSKLLIIYHTKAPWGLEPSIADVCIMDSYIWHNQVFGLLLSKESIGQCPED